MDEIKQQELVTAWISYHENFWAYEALDEYCVNNPELAWQIIQQLVQQAKTEKLLGMLAAGPLESLLNQHGETFIAHVEKLAIQSPRFRRCLANVWCKDMSQAVWSRLQAVSEDS